MRSLSSDDLQRLRYTDGLVPVIAQDRATGAVLMLAWANEEALRRSLESGRMTYWSRSRGALWQKGDTSGNTQRLVALHADCDGDAVLALVEQEGPACHTGTATCWSGEEAPVAGMLGELDRLAAARRQAPQKGHTDALLANPRLAAAKVEEEAGEVAALLRGEGGDDTLAHEAADLLYHLVVALRAGDGRLEDALRELLDRAR